MKLDGRFASYAGAPLSILRDVLPPAMAGHAFTRLAGQILEHGRVNDRSAEGEDAAPAAFRSRFVQYAQRAPWVPQTYSVPGYGSAKLDVFDGFIAVLAGHCVAMTGVAPEIASCNLFRDGQDYLPWHVDSFTLGPTAEEQFVATYSFGATRRVGFRKLDAWAPGDDVVDVPVPHNSLYVMEPDCQRRFAHCVAPEAGGGDPRVSVAFFVRQKDDWQRRPFVVLDLQHGVTHVGAYVEAYARLRAWEKAVKLLAKEERERLKLQLLTRAMDHVRGLVVMTPTGEMVDSSDELQRWAYARHFTDDRPGAVEKPDVTDLQERYSHLGTDFLVAAMRESEYDAEVFEGLLQAEDARRRGETTALATVDESPGLAQRMRRSTPP